MRVRALAMANRVAPTQTRIVLRSATAQRVPLAVRNVRVAIAPRAVPHRLHVRNVVMRVRPKAIPAAAKVMATAMLAAATAARNVRRSVKR